MDVKVSRGQLEAIEPEPASLIETSKGASEMKSPIFTIPTEITMLIFHQCESDIRSRLTLTHTCRRWRQIAVNSASLWTKIIIKTRAINGNSRLDHFLSLLGMQLDRTANLLLDVNWTGHVGDEFFAATSQFLREKAPFSRWKSLEVGIMGGLDDDYPWSGAAWSTADAFTNLEFLYIWNRPENTIVGIIDRTVTSRLKAVHVGWDGPSAEKIASCFAKSLTHITSLRLKSLFPYHYRPFLPANVVNLELAFARQHIFPHIQTYTLRHCIFAKGNTVDLRNLTTLIVRRALMVSFDCQVLLPALRELKLGSLTMEVGAKIEAPILDILYFMTPSGFGIKDDTTLLSDTERSLREDGYRLSPNISVITDSYLPSLTVLDLLAKSPKATHATLRFDDWTEAKAVLERLFQFEAEIDSPSMEIVHLCPRLSELRLDFHWEFSEPSASKEWLINALKARKEPGFRTSLSIYVGRKGEGTYVLLTGG